MRTGGEIVESKRNGAAAIHWGQDDPVQHNLNHVPLLGLVQQPARQTTTHFRGRDLYRDAGGVEDVKPFRQYQPAPVSMSRESDSSGNSSH